jgi:RHS repeat-associated protein
VGNNEGWNWVTSNPSQLSGAQAHQSPLASGIHQHGFLGATNTLAVGSGEVLYAYLYLDPTNPPREVMLQWREGTSWEHRAYWGENLIGWGTNNSNSRRYLGALPPTGGWMRLEVPASLVGLEGLTLNGMAFTLYDGKATWDRAGKGVSKKYYDAGGTRVAMQQGTTKYWLLGDHLGSTSYVVSGATETGELRYRAFGATRFSSGSTPTTHRYTGQREEAGLGLYYYGARWYDPALGRFIQPDAMVPDASDPADFDRYTYARNNPLKYNDPTGHCSDQIETPEDVECWDYANDLIRGGYSSAERLRDCDLRCVELENVL